MMPKRNILQYLCLACVLLLTAGIAVVVAQQSTTVSASTPPPPLPTPPRYTTPNYRDVLAGKVPLRVLVTTRQRMLAWKSNSEVRATNPADGSLLYATKDGEMVGLVRAGEDSSCWLRRNGENFCEASSAVRLEASKTINIWMPTPDTWMALTGPLVITPTADGAFSLAREIALETYLQGVVPAEMPARFHPQALRAQAIIARTYTLCKLGRHATVGADLCAVEHCQMYGGETRRAKETDQALADTRGLVLLYNGKLAEPYYSSTCGGATDDAGTLWGPEYARPYLEGVSDLARAETPALDASTLLAAEDAYCKSSGWSRWTRQFTADEVNALVAKNLPLVTADPMAQIRRVTNMAVEERTPNGRIASLRVEGDGVSVLVRGDQVRWLFGNGAPGPSGLWGTLFELTLTRDAAGALTRYTFRGAGRGHGIGLCQWGAEGRARAGQSYRNILHAYYPGTQLSDEAASGK